MKDFTVYLAGAMQNCPDSVCKDWRTLAKDLLAPLPTLDPMDRDYRDRLDIAFREVVEGDKADIDKAHALLVNAERPSWGTAMEIMYAFMRDKMIVSFGAGPNPSPWLRYHTSLAPNIQAACSFLRRYAEDA